VYVPVRPAVTGRLPYVHEKVVALSRSHTAIHVSPTVGMRIWGHPQQNESILAIEINGPLELVLRFLDGGVGMP
jgi:hypothetical protein